MSKKRNYLVRKAANRIVSKLKRRKRILDLTATSLADVNPRKIAKASGFRRRLRGIGRVIIVKPEVVASWVRGPVGLTEVIKELARRGRLIRGCDGKLTRQVQIPGVGRHRYYCFLMKAATKADQPSRQKEKPASRSSLFDRVNRKSDLQNVLDNARDADAVREMFRREDQEESDDDLRDWGDDDSDQPGIGTVATPGWPVRTVQDFNPSKKP